MQGDHPYRELFLRQKENQFNVGNTTYKERIRKLDQLEKALLRHRYEIRKAMYADFRKPALEVDLTEIQAVTSEIAYVKKKLRSWMAGEHKPTPAVLLGSSAKVVYEPKGVCLIISPWNFPFNLTFGPLVSAIAAGNTVIVKPSEITQHASKLIADIIRGIFPENEVAVIEGGVEETTGLLKLPFNHIFFTGSPAVGKIVMRAAAENLASVTLELGGKSPVVIDRTANLETAARRIAWGKFLNNGQICVSPDYVLVHESVKEDFTRLFKAQIKAFYTENPARSEDYSRIVSDKQFDRLAAHIENARSLGAKIETGGSYDRSQRYIEPVLISDLPDEATLFQEEIFGPVLPLRTFRDIEEAARYIRSGEKPLAMYIYSKSRKNTDYLLGNTRAGTTAINHNILQYSNHYLPFGGSNNSGIGKSHGFYGFEAFSNQRSVLKQHTFSMIELMMPPYGKLKQKLADIALKWF